MNFEELPDPDGSNTLPIPDGPWFSNKTITYGHSKWEVTERTHDGECPKCNSVEQSAVTYAYATGSRASGYTIDDLSGVHRAYVERKN